MALLKTDENNSYIGEKDVRVKNHKKRKIHCLEEQYKLNVIVCSLPLHLQRLRRNISTTATGTGKDGVG